MPSITHGRRTIRLREHDYAGSGSYFVTICAQDRMKIFGQIINGKMELNRFGHIVDRELRATNRIRRYTKMDSWMIMPDHVHFVVRIRGSGRGLLPARGTPAACPYRYDGRGFAIPIPRSLHSIVGQIKSIVTKRIQRMDPSLHSIWQRNYFERIIRSRDELSWYREYIRLNPMKDDDKRSDKGR
jgi:putative transposase